MYHARSLFSLIIVMLQVGKNDMKNVNYGDILFTAVFFLTKLRH